MVGVIQDPSKLAAEGYVRLEPRCPLFDGEVAQQVEEWLDENVANSKASSTLKIIEDVPMYQSAWAKWEDWASTFTPGKVLAPLMLAESEEIGIGSNQRPPHSVPATPTSVMFKTIKTYQKEQKWIKINEKHEKSIENYQNG